MSEQKDILAFLTSAEAQSTTWHVDPTTGEVVATCESCEAQNRYSPDQLDGAEFHFSHRLGCSFAMPPKANGPRAQRVDSLIDRLSFVLDGEPDAGVKLSVLAFVSAVITALAAQDSNRPAAAMTGGFVEMYEADVARVRKAGIGSGTAVVH